MAVPVSLVSAGRAGSGKCHPSVRQKKLNHNIVFSPANNHPIGGELVLKESFNNTQFRRTKIVSDAMQTLLNPPILEKKTV